MTLLMMMGGSEAGAPPSGIPKPLINGPMVASLVGRGLVSVQVAIVWLILLKVYYG